MTYECVSGSQRLAPQSKKGESDHPLLVGFRGGATPNNVSLHLRPGRVRAACQEGSQVSGLQQVIKVGDENEQAFTPLETHSCHRPQCETSVYAIACTGERKA